MATLTGSDFDPIKWAHQGFYRTAEGKRAHLMLCPRTGATLLVVESAADALAYQTTRDAIRVACERGDA